MITIARLGAITDVAIHYKNQKAPSTGLAPEVVLEMVFLIEALRSDLEHFAGEELVIEDTTIRGLLGLED